MGNSGSSGTGRKKGTGDSCPPAGRVPFWKGFKVRALELPHVATREQPGCTEGCSPGTAPWESQSSLVPHLPAQIPSPNSMVSRKCLFDSVGLGFRPHPALFFSLPSPQSTLGNPSPQSYTHKGHFFRGMGTSIWLGESETQLQESLPLHSSYRSIPANPISPKATGGFGERIKKLKAWWPVGSRATE